MYYYLVLPGDSNYAVLVWKNPFASSAHNEWSEDNKKYSTIFDKFYNKIIFYIKLVYLANHIHGELSYYQYRK